MKMGVPELEAKRYEDRLQRREILLSVHCRTVEEAKVVTEVLKRTGGQDACTVAPSAGATTDPELALKTARRSN